MIEVLITFQLENRFNKQQIFEMYANEMNLGHRGSYEINGVGEAAQAFFGKNLSQLDLAQCATLAGLLQNPSYRNPYRHPDRAMERRNVVLDSMVETGAITASEAARAKAEPLQLAPPMLTPVKHRTSSISSTINSSSASAIKTSRTKAYASTRLSTPIYNALPPRLLKLACATSTRSFASSTRLPRASSPAPSPTLRSRSSRSTHTPGQILALVGGRKLRRLPTQPRCSEAPHRLHLQTFHLRSRLQYQPQRHVAG